VGHVTRISIGEKEQGPRIKQSVAEFVLEFVTSEKTTEADRTTI